MRFLLDADGREWRVYERTSSEASPQPGRQSLVFDTDGMVRRMWQYPGDWMSMSDEELLLLMADAGGTRSAAD
jgi:hypothetical protein